MREQEYLEQRLAMVETQIRARGVEGEHLLARLAVVPRHCFVPRNLAGQAYADHPLPIGAGQTISQPYMVACMTALLELCGGDRVLEIGTGSGYQTAILAGLCREVVTIESVPALHAGARACLGQLGIRNVQFHCGDGSRGYAPGAPYDAILVTAGSPHVPPSLPAQLGEGGRLVCPVGDRKQQQLLRVIKRGGEFVTTAHTNCIFVPLVGEEGWHVSQE